MKTLKSEGKKQINIEDKEKKNNKYKNEYNSAKLISFLLNKTDSGGGYCPACKEYCYFPPSFKLIPGKVVHCFHCGGPIGKVIAIKVTEEEI